MIPSILLITFPSLPNMLTNFLFSFFLIIAAPAPSPNNTQVFLSVISSLVDICSLPITSAYGLLIPSINEAAIFNPYKKPEHAAFISNAIIPLESPSSCCNTHDTAGV